MGQVVLDERNANVDEYTAWNRLAPAVTQGQGTDGNVGSTPDAAPRAFHGRDFAAQAAGLFGDPYAPRVTVVIPAMNEERNLPHVLPLIPKWVQEVILVDGHSTDNSIAVARELRPDIRVIAQVGKGKGDALRAGFAAAQGDIIVMLDADGSTDPREIPAYVGALLAGADYAKGSRFMQGGGTADMDWFRRLGNWGLTLLARLAFGGNFSDLCYGYNAFWTRVLPSLDLDADGFEIETLMNVRALRAQLRVAEVHSFEAPRVYGESRLRAIPDGFRVLRTIVRERFAPDNRRHAGQPEHQLEAEWAARENSLSRQVARQRAVE